MLLTAEVCGRPPAGQPRVLLSDMRETAPKASAGSSRFTRLAVKAGTRADVRFHAVRAAPVGYD
jgi:hypothetical protein